MRKETTGRYVNNMPRFSVNQGTLRLHNDYGSDDDDDDDDNNDDECYIEEELINGISVARFSISTWLNLTTTTTTTNNNNNNNSVYIIQCVYGYRIDKKSTNVLLVHDNQHPLLPNSLQTYNSN